MSEIKDDKKHEKKNDNFDPEFQKWGDLEHHAKSLLDKKSWDAWYWWNLFHSRFSMKSSSFDIDKGCYWIKTKIKSKLRFRQKNYIILVTGVIQP